MKKSKYSDAQIMSMLNQAEGGVPDPDPLHCKHCSKETGTKLRQDQTAEFGMGSGVSLAL